MCVCVYVCKFISFHCVKATTKGNSYVVGNNILPY